MNIDTEIDVLVLLDKQSGDNKVVYLSKTAYGDQALSLYVTESGNSFVLYSSDAFYNEKLQNRYEHHNMLHPDNPKERIVLVGSVFRDIPYKKEDYILISRSTLKLANAPFNEI